MAYISEINYYDPYANTTAGEFVEITLSAAEFANRSNFNISFYEANSSLGQVFNLGSLNLIQDAGVGDNGYVQVGNNYVFVIYETMAYTGNNNPNNQHSAVALSDSTASPELITFIDIAGGNAINPTTGPAAGIAEADKVILPHINGQSYHIDKNGNITNGPTTPGQPPICFCAGTTIATAFGDVLIEDLKIGDMVLTADRGLQPIRWIGKRYMSFEELEAAPHLRPVRIRKEKMAPNVPRNDVMLSPHHRVLIHSKIAERMFNSDEVFIDAKHLCEYVGIAQVKPDDGVTYMHLLFDHHEIIYAEGMPCESLHTGKMAMESLSPEARLEIVSIFPAVFEDGFDREFARKSPPNKRQKELVKRHIRKQRQLIERYA